MEQIWIDAALNLSSGAVGVILTLLLTGWWNWRDRRKTRHALEQQALLDYITTAEKIGDKLAYEAHKARLELNQYLISEDALANSKITEIYIDFIQHYQDAGRELNSAGRKAFTLVPDAKVREIIQMDTRLFLQHLGSDKSTPPSPERSSRDFARKILDNTVQPLSEATGAFNKAMRDNQLRLLATKQLAQRPRGRFRRWGTKLKKWTLVDLPGVFRKPKEKEIKPD